MIFNIITLFPESIEPYLNSSILKRGIENEFIKVNLIQLRDFSSNKHKQVDDYTFGGGSGMVIMAQPLIDALETVKGHKIYMSPKGKTLTQNIAYELSKKEEITLVCGHYEGIDQRVIDNYIDEEISIGDYILTGGELGALVLVDSVSRLVDGVIKESSHLDESFSNYLLEYPHYTKPRDYKGLEVPPVLFGGNHKLIEEYRFEESVKLTIIRRPDLIENGISKNIFSKKQLKTILNVKKSLIK
jgi:tRNA (guanine37-N1)-methyltransferase